MTKRSPPKVSGLVNRSGSNQGQPPSRPSIPIKASFGASHAPSEASALDEASNTALPKTNVDGFQLVDSSSAVLIPVRLLDDSPDQYRLSYDEDELEALASTLRVRQRDPIEVRRKADGRFEIIKGHRRKRAAIRSGMEFLKAVIVDLDDKDAAIDLILSNESQEQVGDFERAIAYKNLLAYGLSQADITRELGISSRSTVSQRLRFLDLPPAVQDALREYPRAYSYHTAGKLLGILETNPELVDAIVEGTRKVGAGDWDVAVLISTLRQKQAKTSGTNKPKTDLAIVDKQNRPVLTLRPGKKPGIVEIGLADSINRSSFLELLGAVLRKQVEEDGFLPAEQHKP